MDSLIDTVSALLALYVFGWAVVRGSRRCGAAFYRSCVTPKAIGDARHKLGRLGE